MDRYRPGRAILLCGRQSSRLASLDDAPRRNRQPAVIPPLACSWRFLRSFDVSSKMRDDAETLCRLKQLGPDLRRATESAYPSGRQRQSEQIVRIWRQSGYYQYQSECKPPLRCPAGFRAPRMSLTARLAGPAEGTTASSRTDPQSGPQSSLRYSADYRPPCNSLHPRREPSWLHVRKLIAGTTAI